MYFLKASLDQLAVEGSTIGANAEQLLYKYKNLCETNDPYHFKEKIDQKYLQIEEIEKKIISGEDIIGRNEFYKSKKLDNTFPSQILENIKKYEEWIVN